MSNLKTELKALGQILWFLTKGLAFLTYCWLVIVSLYVIIGN